jgi:hypothetical protein
LYGAQSVNGTAHKCQLKPESVDKFRFYHSPDPPKSPLRRGVGVDFDRTLVPPFLRGARGDLDLIVKQQSLTGFEIKLTRMDTAVSLQLIGVGLCLKYFVGWLLTVNS